MTTPTSALTARTVHSSVRVALVVGTILVAINQGPALFAGRVSPALAVQVALTYAVPFLVSLYAAWRAVEGRASTERRPAVPDVTRDQMIELDRAVVEDYHIDLMQMMENAGSRLARLARDRFLDGSSLRRRVVVLAGSGNNAGGALAAARHLHNWGAEIRVFVAVPPNVLTGVPGRQLEILRRLGVSIEQADAVSATPPPELIIDGIIGYRLSGPPRSGAADLIRWANSQGAPILALDLPSGLEPTTGAVLEPAIRAAATLTLALPKTGLRSSGGKVCGGDLYLADIGVPARLYAGLGVVPGGLFAGGEIVRLR